VGDGFKWPSMQPTKLKRLLGKLGYMTDPNSTTGSHEWLVCPGRQRIRWAFHTSKRELAPIEVRNVLLEGAGLQLEEAKRLVQGR
jgi:hypothetical protein